MKKKSITINNKKIEIMHHNQKTALGILAGAAIGAAVGVLLAPAKGEDTRKKIKDNANDLKSKAEDELNKITSTAKEKYSEISEKVSEKFSNALNKTKSSVNELETEFDAMK